MSELRATPGALRVPPDAAAAAAGLVVAALTAASLLHPELGLYVTQAVGLVTGILAAGLVLSMTTSGPRPAAPSATSLVATLATVAFVAGVCSLGFSVLTVAGNGLRGLSDGLARDVVLRGGDGQSVAVRCLGLVAVSLSVRTRAAGRTARLFAVAGAVTVAGSFLLAGHTRTHGPAVLVVLCALAHVLAAAAWVGGLVALALSLRAAHGDQQVAAMLLTRFARLMSFVLTTLLAGGVGLAVLYLPEPAALVQTAYGQVLLIKLALVAGLLVISSANHYRLVPLAASGKARAVQVLRTNIAVEQIALITVLLITAVLMRQSPGG